MKKDLDLENMHGFYKLEFPLKEKYKEHEFSNTVYLIDVGDVDNFPLYRKLFMHEIKNYHNKPDKWILEYEGNQYLFLHNFASLKDAELAVNGYWRALSEVGELMDKETLNS